MIGNGVWVGAEAPWVEQGVSSQQSHQLALHQSLSQGQRRTQGDPFWVPLLTLAGLWLFCIAGFTHFQQHENTLVQEYVDARVRSVRDRIRGYINERTTAASLLSAECAEFELQGGLPEFERRVALVFGEVGGYQALNWVNTSGFISHIYPENTMNARVLNLNLNLRSMSSEALNEAIARKSPMATIPANLAQGPPGFAIYYPVFTEDKGYLGSLNAVFLLNNVVKNSLDADLISDLGVEVTVDGVDPDSVKVTIIPENFTGTNKFGKSLPLEFYGQRWRVKVTPSKHSVDSLLSAIDELLFLAALLASLVVSYFVRRHLLDQRAVAFTGERFRQILNQGFDGVVLFDQHLKIIDANAEFCNQCGYELQELVLLPLDAFVEYDDLERNLHTTIEILDHQPSQLENLILRRRDTKALPVEARIGRITTPLQDVYVALVRDISERRKAETAVRIREEEINRLMRNLPGMAYRYNSDGTPRFVSKGCELLTGYSREDIMLGPLDFFESLVVTDDREAFHTNRKLHAASGQPYSMTYRIKRKDGKVAWVLDRGLGIRGENNDVIGLDGFILDISDQKKAVEEVKTLSQTLEHRVTRRTQQLESMRNDAESAREIAEAASRAKSEFLSSVSHEMRTPLHVMLGLMELMSFSELSLEQARNIQTMRESGRALLHIIDDVLDLSRIEAGRLELVTQETSIATLAENTCEMLAESARARNVLLRCIVDPSLPARVEIDPVRVQQIMVNLVGNAIKFTAEGEVRLTIERVPGVRDTVRILVSDTGIGMDPQAAAQLFQPFTQADSTTSRRYGGTGLGLSICRRLATLMKGAIYVSSEKGVGSTFCVVIPVEPARGRRTTSLRARLLHGLAVSLHGWSTDDAEAVYLRDAILLSGGAMVPATDPVLSDNPETTRVLLVNGLTEAASETLGAVVPDARLVVICQNEAAVERLKRELSPGHAVDRVEWLTHPCRRKRTMFSLARVAGRDLPERMPSDSDARPIPVGRGLQGVDDKRALIAEDSPTNIELLQRQLELIGIPADVAHDGREALEMLSERHYDVLLTDIQMPGMDGFALAARVRERERSGDVKRLPIIAFTANALRGERERCLRAGMDDYLSKPVSFGSLRKVLKHWLLPGAEPEPDESNGHDDTSDVKLADARTRVVPHQHIELDPLQEFYADKPERLERLLRRFQETGEQISRLLEQAQAAGDLMAMQAHAHKLKSAASTLGADLLRHLCTAVESASRSEDPEQVVGPLHELHEELRVVMGEVEAACVRLNPEGTPLRPSDRRQPPVDDGSAGSEA